MDPNEARHTLRFVLVVGSEGQHFCAGLPDADRWTQSALVRKNASMPRLSRGPGKKLQGLPYRRWLGLDKIVQNHGAMLLHPRCTDACGTR